jgi:hypothetical protein
LPNPLFSSYLTCLTPLNVLIAAECWRPLVLGYTLSGQKILFPLFLRPSRR